MKEIDNISRLAGVKNKESTQLNEGFVEIDSYMPVSSAGKAIADIRKMINEIDDYVDIDEEDSSSYEDIPDVDDSSNEEDVGLKPHHIVETLIGIIKYNENMKAFPHVNKHVKNILTYNDSGLVTKDDGLVLRLTNGKEIHITVHPVIEGGRH